MIKENEILLFENEVTFENLIKTFNEVSIDARINPDGRLRVQDEKLVIYVEVFPSIKLISFCAFLKFDDSVSTDTKYTSINSLNERVKFARFAIDTDDEGTFSSDYHLPYNNAIPIWTIIVALRHFEKATLMALKEMDEAGIVR
jgi:hypothetical protein